MIQEQFTQIGSTGGAVETATQTRPVGNFPVDQRFPGGLCFGLAVIGVTGTQLKLQHFDAWQIIDYRNQGFNIIVVDLGAGIEITGRVNADHLVREGILRLQDVGHELGSVVAHLVTTSHAQFTGRQFHHRTLQVDLNDVLLVRRPRLQRGVDSLEAVG